MATNKDLANKTTNETCMNTMEKYHWELFDAEVEVTIFMVTKVDKFGNRTGEPALKKSGQNVAATVRKSNQRELKLGSGDIIIEVDEVAWDNLSVSQSIALFDHELCHVGLKKDKEGAIELTPDNRPKIKMIHHDVEVGIFYDVIVRHGSHSLDLLNSNHMFVGVHKAKEDYDETNKDPENDTEE